MRNDLSIKIKGQLGLKKSPVAIKLFLHEEDVPDKVFRIDGD